MVMLKMGVCILRLNLGRGKQHPITTNFSHDSWRMILLSRKTSKAIIAGQINAASPGMPQRAYVSKAAT
jgi:hypothetical protein